MRVLRLNLQAFGPFTDQALVFDGNARLHVIQGPNEAGKSSALRALRGLLFGIPQQTPDNFVHPYTNLRIGGLLEAADGTQMEFIRRKARSNTLREPDDVQVFDEARLLKVLGGIDESTFAQRFGIDYVELQRGGKALVEGHGDLGEILFAAGAGVADLRNIQKSLEDEADALFKPRGSNQRISQNLLAFKKTHDEIRDAQLPTAEWEKHDRELRAAGDRQRKIKKELQRKRVEHSRLDRVLKSLPLIGKLQPLRQQLAEVAAVPLLPEGFPAERSEAQMNLANAEGARTKACDEMRRLQENLNRIKLPVELLEQRTAIAELSSERASYRKDRQRRPSLVAKRDAARQQSQKLLQQLGQPLELSDAESLRLSKGQRRRIQQLAGECRALIEKQSATEDAIAELEAAIQHKTDDIQRLSPARDEMVLRRTIRNVQKHGDLDTQAQVARAELDACRADSDVALAQLQRFDDTLAVLEKLTVPPVETIDRFERELAKAQEECRRRQDAVAQLVASIQKLQTELDALSLEADVPTEADLEQARAERDAGWSMVQQVLRGDSVDTLPGVAEFIAATAAGEDLAAAFRASLDKADAVADRLRREAARVTRKARTMADLRLAESTVESARTVEAQAEQDLRQLEDAWHREWAATGITPLPPREMRSWRVAWQDLADQACDIRNREAALQRLHDQIATSRTELYQCLEWLEQPLPAEATPLAILLDHCQEIADQIGADNRKREQLASEAQGFAEQRPRAEREADEARAAVEQWRSAWAKSVAVIGLDADARPAEANEVIETVDELLARFDEVRSLGSEIETIDRDSEAFAQAVQRVLQAVAPDLLQLLDESVDQAVAQLADRLEKSQQDQARCENWQERLQELQTTRQAAEADIARWRSALEQLCRQAECDAPDQLPRAEANSTRRREAESNLHTLEERLVELAAGTPLEEWIETVGTFDSDLVRAQLDALDAAIEQLDQEKQHVSETIGEHRNELARMNGSGEAADARNRAEYLLAAIRDDAEEYVLRRLASVVLARAMERFRKASQGPVMSRSSELFSLLTCQSFAGVRADYDTNGNVILVGVRPTGQSVELAGMSVGTCDQLYLALRLALLESALEGREAIPFIVDDILIMFDDARAAAALQALARLSEKTQVIFFTHHEHLVEIARDELGKDNLDLVTL